MAIPPMITAYKRHTTVIDQNGVIKEASKLYYIPSYSAWVDVEGYCYPAHHPQMEFVKMIEVDFPQELAKRVSEFANKNFQDVDERFIIQLKLKDAFSL